MIVLVRPSAKALPVELGLGAGGDQGLLSSLLEGLRILPNGFERLTRLFLGQRLSLRLLRRRLVLGWWRSL